MAMIMINPTKSGNTDSFLQAKGKALHFVMESPYKEVSAFFSWSLAKFLRPSDSLTVVVIFLGLITPHVCYIFYGLTALCIHDFTVHLRFMRTCFLIIKRLFLAMGSTLAYNALMDLSSICLQLLI
ncbi:hypothetical protein CsSME_00009957 [Camellia sinensis var. sinensis]